jgi:hypothetical protein
VTFLCWRWQPPPGYRSKFDPSTVRILRNMLRRHYAAPHRFVCVTDAPHEIDADIETIKLWDDWKDIPSPHGAHNPSCYRRLRAFAANAAEWVGDTRFASLDLDMVLCRDVRPIFDRPEPFVSFGETDPRSFYNGSAFLLTAGARRQVYDRFVANPMGLRDEAKANRKFGSDQGIISHVLGPGEAIWRPSDGFYSFRVHLQSGLKPLPADARVVAFHGSIDPWSPRAQRLEWVRRHWQ